MAADRVYADHREMAEVESQRADGIDLAVVATPNDSHFEIARTGPAPFSAICDRGALDAPRMARLRWGNRTLRHQLASGLASNPLLGDPR